jgi:hypothetical protein
MRLIDADALEEGKFHSIEDWTPIESASWQRGWNDAIDAIIDNAPTVDAVEVVRCEDCKFFEDEDEDGDCWCYCDNDITCRDGYCSWGVKK